MTKLDLNAIKGLVAQAIVPERIDRGRRRQQLVAQRKMPDYAPLLLGHIHDFVGDSKDNRSYKLGDHFMRGGTPTPEIEDYPHVNSVQQIASPKAMLYEALWEVLSWARTPSDAQLSVRPNLAFILPTCFGMKYQVNDEGGAWFTNQLTIDQALDTDLDNIDNLGDVPRVLEHLNFFKDNVPEGIEISCPIAVGPLSQIDYIIGESIWTAFHDSPEKLHRLIDKVTDAMIMLLKLYKETLGQPIETLHTGPLYLSPGGIKVSNDSLVMLSPVMFKEFIQPAMDKLYKTFSGGYHHSCGYYPDHLDILCKTQSLSTINFGQPELWDMPDAVDRIYQSGKFYYGPWHRKPDESIEDYLQRGVELCGPQRNRAILFAKGDGPWPDPAKIMDIWHRLQDQMLPD
jgi:hypothetical protein